MAAISRTPVEMFKKAYYQTDETDPSQYTKLLEMANSIIYPTSTSQTTSSVGSSGAGGWSSGRKQLTRKKKHRVSNKLKTRKH